MSADIPQDQIETLARALCAFDHNRESCGGSESPCTVWIHYKTEAIAAIRVLTPLIAAVERERCAALCDELAADLQCAMEAATASNVARGFQSPQMGRVVSYSADAAKACAKELRSVKGAVT